MSLSRLRWTAVLAPLVFLLALDLVRYLIYPELLHAWPGCVLIGGIVLFGALLFSEIIFGLIRRVQEQLAQQNRELLALHQAGLGTPVSSGSRLFCRRWWTRLASFKSGAQGFLLKNLDSARFFGLLEGIGRGEPALTLTPYR